MKVNKIVCVVPCSHSSQFTLDLKKSTLQSPPAEMCGNITSVSKASTVWPATLLLVYIPVHVGNSTQLTASFCCIVCTSHVFVTEGLSHTGVFVVWRELSQVTVYSAVTHKKMFDVSLTTSERIHWGIYVEGKDSVGTGSWW